MKLFVWNNPYRVSYGSSMAFAVAETEEQAREIATASPAYAYGEYEQKTPQVKLGAPDRIVELPCAEWHRWSE